MFPFSDLYSPLPPTTYSREDPQAWIKDLPQSNFANILLKSWKLGEKMGKKSISRWDFCMLILHFSQEFQILIGFSPEHAKICR